MLVLVNMRSLVVMFLVSAVFHASTPYYGTARADLDDVSLAGKIGLCSLRFD